jgi:flagellar M-ring protein FliF
MAEQVEALPAGVADAAVAASGARGGLAALLGALGAERIVAITVAILALVGLLGFLGMRALESPYTLLYAGLALEDTRTIVTRLQAMDVPHRLSPAGDAVLVPADRVLDLRMALATDGLPGGGVVGYEIFDAVDAFGTTEFLSNINLKRAMEGELARTIASLRQVRSARVHLVQPPRELFRREQAPASASVFLSVGPAGLGRSEIAAIQHLVASAVPGLEPGRIAIADDAGRLLSRGGDALDTAIGLDDTDGYRQAFESRLQAKILQLLERSLGVGRVEAQVTAELDFDSVSTTEEIFDPERQVVRSTQLVDESTELDESTPNDAVSVANNLPGGDAQGAAATNREQRNRNEETINYEISRTVRNQTRHGGRLQRLSVAVQVDGTYRDGADGVPVFEPLPAADLAELETLVRGAVGIDDERGDTLSIISRRLARPEPLPVVDDGTLLGFAHADLMRFAELGGLAGIALLVLLLGVRPLLRRLQPARTGPGNAGGVRLLTGPDGRQLLIQATPGTAVTIDERGNPVVTRNGQPGDAAGEQTGDRVSLRQIEGDVRESLLTDMAELIEDRPEDAIRVIRSWLHSS